MNLLRFIKITFITGLISFTATSCMDDNDYTPSIHSYATILLSADNPAVIVPNESPYYFLAEDSTRLFPTNPGVLLLSELKNNQRCILSFTKNENEYGTTKSATESLLIEITGIKEILTKDILLTSKIDTIGNNIVKPLGIWYSGGVHGAKDFINFHFNFYAGNTPQYVYLVDNSENASPIIDGYYQLEFRVSGKSNMYSQVIDGLVSFPLTDKYLHEDIKGLRISLKEDTTDKVTVKDYPYSTK